MGSAVDIIVIIIIMPPKLAPGQKFTEGEKVLCFHGPLLYEAKITKVDLKDKLIKYFVHYNGWNKSWDEWVPENRALKFNDANVDRQNQLFAAAEAAKKKKKKTLDGGDFSVPSPTSSESRSGKTTSRRSEAAATSSTSGKESSETKSAVKKVKIEPNVETEAEYLGKVEVKINVPVELKRWLIDDWDLITRQKKLVEIPSRYSVDQILDDYLKSKSKGNKAKESQVKDVVDGIREYFNSMLGCQLLYRFERPQYQKIDKSLSDEFAMSSQYGVIHLVRLFVKIGQMLVYTELDVKEITVLDVHFQDFMKFIGKQGYFSEKDYVTAPPEYLRKVQT